MTSTRSAPGPAAQVGDRPALTIMDDPELVAESPTAREAVPLLAVTAAQAATALVPWRKVGVGLLGVAVVVSVVAVLASLREGSGLGA